MLLGEETGSCPKTTGFFPETWDTAFAMVHSFFQQALSNCPWYFSLRPVVCKIIKYIKTGVFLREPMFYRQTTNRWLVPTQTLSAFSWNVFARDSLWPSLTESLPLHHGHLSPSSFVTPPDYSLFKPNFPTNSARHLRKREDFCYLFVLFCGPAHPLLPPPRYCVLSWAPLLSQVSWHLKQVAISGIQLLQ